MTDTGEVLLRCDIASLKGAIDELTDVAVPMIVLVEARPDRLVLSSHDPEGTWWASATAHAEAEGHPHASIAAVTVPRLVLREAIEYAQLVGPWVDIAVRDTQSVAIRGTLVGVTRSSPPIPAPPQLGSPSASGVWVSDARCGDEECVLDVGLFEVAIAALSWARYTRREIKLVDVHRVGDAAFVVGSPEDRELRHDFRLTVTARVTN